MADEQKLSDLLIEWDEQRRSGSEPSVEELCHDCPELADEVASRIQSLKQTDWLFADDTDESFLSLPVGRVQRGEDGETDLPHFVRPTDHEHESSDTIDLPETTLTVDEFATAVVESTLLTADDLKPVRDSLADDSSAADLARELIWAGQLTVFQASSLLEQKPLPLVLGDYAILDRIGAGGMGEVYKARHRRMKRVVALKILPHELTDDEAALKRFNREVEIVASLEHPNIVTAHDAGEQNGTHYLIMQFVDGCDLTTLIRSSGVLPVEQAVDFTLQAARGLAHAHGEGVIHRDIKPSNLLVDTRGRVKILDLGLARVDVPAAQQIENRDGLTTTGAVMGTIDYMAPEQAVNTRTADHRADVYSLGCTLHFLLTGNPPYGGETMMERLLAHREQPIPSLPSARADVPDELDAVFQKLLAKQPDERFGSMADVVAALDAIVGRVQRGNSTDTDSATTALPHSVRPTDEVGRVQRGDSDTDSETQLVNQPALAVAEQQSELQVASPDETLNQSTVNTDPSLAETVIKPAAESSQRSGRFKWIALAVLLLGTAFYAASPLFKVKTRGGTLVFAGDPNVLEIASVTIDGDQVDLEFDGKEYTVDVDQDSNKVRIETSDGTELLATDFTFKVGENRLPLSISSRPRETRQADANTPPHSVRPTPTWQPGPENNVLPGLVPRPAAIPGIKRWQVETRNIRTEPGRVDVSPDGQLVAIGDASGVVRLYDTETLDVVRILPGHSHRVTEVAWSPDGTRLASGSYDETICVWSRDGRLLRVMNNAGDLDVRNKPLRIVVGIAWHPDGNRLAATYNYRGLLVWDVETGNAVQRFLEDDGMGQGVAWSPTGDRLAAVSHDGTLWMWSERGTAIFKKDGRVTEGNIDAVLAWSPGGQTLVTNGADGFPCMFSPDGELMQKLPLEGTAFNYARQVRWFPDGKHFTKSHYGNLHIWNADGTLKSRIGPDSGLNWHGGYADWMPDGKSLIGATANGAYPLIYRATIDGTVLQERRFFASNTWSRAWSPDGSLVALGGFHGHRWQLSYPFGGLRLGYCPNNAGIVSALSWSPDGLQIAAATGRGVRLRQSDETTEQTLGPDNSNSSEIA